MLRNVLPLSKSAEIPRGNVDGQIGILARRCVSGGNIHRFENHRILCPPLEDLFDSINGQSSDQI